MSGDDNSSVAYAVELRSELLNIYCGDDFVREGRSDHLEIGRGASWDYVEGHEDVRVGRNLRETTGHGRTTVVSETDIKVDGGMALHGKSETTLLGGGMRETHLGAEFLAAAMSDDLIAGAGARVTAPVDLWACGLYGMEENIGVVAADGMLTEAYAMALDREFIYGMHNIGTACFSGILFNTQASGFRGLIRSTAGINNILPSGGGGGAAAATPGATPPPPANLGVATGATLLAARSGRGIEDAEDSRFLIDAVQAGEDIAQVAPELEDTRLLDTARMLDYTEVLASADEFLMSEDGVQFFRQGDDLADLEDGVTLGEDGVTAGVAVGDEPGNASIYDSPWEHQDWYDEQINTRRQGELPATPNFEGGDSRIYQDPSIIDSDSPFAPTWDELDFRIAELDAWKADEIADGNLEIADTLDTSIRFLQSVQDQLALVDEAGNPVHTSPLDALNAAYDDILATADAEQAEFMEALRDDYRRAWNDPTAPVSPQIDDAAPVVDAPLVHTADSLEPEFGGPISTPLPEPDPDAEWGLYAISAPIGPQVPSPGGIQPVADNAISAGTEVDQIVEFEVLYTAGNPISSLDEGFGIGDESAGSGMIYEDPSELLARSSGTDFSSSDEAGNYTKSIHDSRMEHASDLSVEGSVVGSDEHARLSTTGVPDGDATPSGIYDQVRPENIDPSVQPIYDEIRPENIDPSVQPIYDEIRPENIDPSIQPIYDQIRPENISANYGELAGSPAPVWNSQDPPSMIMVGPEYDVPPLERAEHEYEEIGAYWNRGSKDWHGPVWKPSADPIAIPPTDFEIERVILAGGVPEGVDTTELVDGWRSMESLYRQQAADLSARGRTWEAANVMELANVYGDMADKLASGAFSLDELRDVVAKWTGNSLMFPDNAMGAQAIAGMVTEYQKVVSDAVGWRADPDWLAAVTRLDDAQASGDATEIIGAQRGMADLFDEKFPPPSWIDGQRPVGDDIYSVPQTEVAKRVSNDFRPADWDPTRTPPIETVQFYSEADDANKLMIGSEETFELIQQGLVKVELFGDFVDNDGNRVFKLTQDQDDVLRIGDYDIVLDPACVVPPIEDMDEFVRQWWAERGTRVKDVGDFLEENISDGVRVENVSDLLDNVPEAHGLAAGGDAQAIMPDSFSAAEQSTSLGTVPAEVDMEDASELARYYSEGAGRGPSAITSADINSPIFDDPVYMTASVEFEPSATRTADSGLSADELADVGNGTPPPVPEQRSDLLFSNPYADQDDLDVDQITESESTVQRVIAAQDTADGTARVIVNDDSVVPTVMNSESGGGTGTTDGVSRSGSGNAAATQSGAASTATRGGSSGGTSPIYEELTGARTVASADEPVPHTLEPPNHSRLQWLDPSQWLDPLPGMLLSGGSHGVPLAPEPQLVDVMFQTWFHQIVEITRPLDELTDSDGAHEDGKNTGGTGVPQD